MQKFASTLILVTNAIATPAFNGAEYIAKSASDKSEAIWAAVTKDTKSASWYNAV